MPQLVIKRQWAFETLMLERDPTFLPVRFGSFDVLSNPVVWVRARVRVRNHLAV